MSRFDTATREQRLEWQFADERRGLEDDLTLAEQHEVADDAFRHWDTFIFAPPSVVVAGANGGGLACHAVGGPSPSNVAPAAKAALLGGTDTARDGAVVNSSGSSDGCPELTRPMSLPAGGAAVFPPSGRSALPSSDARGKPVSVGLLTARPSSTTSTTRSVTGGVSRPAPSNWQNWLWAA